MVRSNLQKNVIFLVAVTLMAAWLVWEWFLSPANREFILIKDWRQSADQFPDESPDAMWAHRQCHEQMMGSSLKDLAPVPLGAKSIKQINNRVWQFELRDLARWSDGNVLTSEDFVKAWTYRKSSVKSPMFSRILEIRAVDTSKFEVELDGEVNESLDLRVLSSIWISPLKETSQAWSWDHELSGPCDGPWVTAIKDNLELRLKRNKYWHGFDKSLIRYGRVRAEQSSKGVAQDLFTEGKLSYVDASVDPTLKPVDTSGEHSFLQHGAWYIFVNSTGAFSGAKTAFVHHAINRGELASVISGSSYLAPMYRAIPLTFVDAAGGSVVRQWPNLNVESVLEARRAIGLTADPTKPDETKPFTKPIKIFAPDDNDITPVLERFAERLKSNYRIDSVIVLESEGEQPEASSYDLVFARIETNKGAASWAKSLLGAYEEFFAMPPKLKGPLKQLSAMADAEWVTPQQQAIIANIDKLPLSDYNIVAVGQFGSNYLLARDASGVVVVGDPGKDPDISRAKWVKSPKK